MTAIVIQGDAARLPLPDASVDLVVTSPPYWALRSYTDGGEHYDGQIGSEATPGMFLDALWACTVEWARVLKPTGSIMVNLGDKYNAYNGGRADGTVQKNGPRPVLPKGSGLDVKGIRPKSLLGMPWRYAIGCIDQLGLILRAEIIWDKPNGLPESVTDRVRRSHEQWFHLVKEPRYFSAVDEIREGYAPATAARYAAGFNPRAVDQQRPTIGTKLGGDQYDQNPLGKLPGSVWSIATQPLHVPAELNVDHFAAYPFALIRPIVRGWSPPDGVVLDPFGGTGTTALVASMHGRIGISLDASADYGRIAQWRTQDPKERARAAGLDPDAVAAIRTEVKGQESLLDLLGDAS